VTPPSRWEREASKVTREVARRAIRRLDVLEWVILAVTAVLAVGGGGLVAVLLVGQPGNGFRGTWIVTSLLLLIVPGVVVLARHRRDERKRNAESLGQAETDEHG
jgi:uncharacterized membrane protein